MGWHDPDQLPWFIAIPIAIALWGTYFWMTRKDKKEKK